MSGRYLKGIFTNWTSGNEKIDFTQKMQLKIDHSQDIWIFNRFSSYSRWFNQHLPSANHLMLLSTSHSKITFAKNGICGWQMRNLLQETLDALSIVMFVIG